VKKFNKQVSVENGRNTMLRFSAMNQNWERWSMDENYSTLIVESNGVWKLHYPLCSFSSIFKNEVEFLFKSRYEFPDFKIFSLWKYHNLKMKMIDTSFIWMGSLLVEKWNKQDSMESRRNTMLRFSAMNQDWERWSTDENYSKSIVEL
jgi:hypothetical protein